MGGSKSKQANKKHGQKLQRSTETKRDDLSTSTRTPTTLDSGGANATLGSSGANATFGSGEVNVSSRPSTSSTYLSTSTRTPTTLVSSRANATFGSSGGNATFGSVRANATLGSSGANATFGSGEVNVSSRPSTSSTFSRRDDEERRRMGSAVSRRENDRRTRSAGGGAWRDQFLQTVRIGNPKQSALLVVAIDFGTTYSGYGYSFKASPDEFLTNYWDEVNLKTPTEVLLDPEKNLHSFGYHARRHFKNLVKSEEHKRWYFFSRFKMKLFVRDGPLNIDMKLTDIGDKELPAAAIKYMMDHCKHELNRRRDHVTITSNTDVHWIITVPAIWDDLSKRFMRQAANMAGIDDKMLSIALEPEAASLFCKKNYNIAIGTRYMVLDLGGGTADITCHQVHTDGTLKELHKPTGGDFGGTSVDEGFMDILYRLIGAKTFKKFRTEYMDEYWELLQEFERKKRFFDGSDRIVFQFPVQLLELHDAATGEPITETLDSSPLRGQVEFKQGKMFMKRGLVKELFDTTLEKIVRETRKVTEQVDNIEHIILVGGFSESKYLQAYMEERFRGLIRVPREPAGAVLTGAVIYGHETKAISSRKCKFTYGIARMMKFKSDQHPDRKRKRVGNMDYCDDLFNKHIEIGQSVSLDSSRQAEEQEYFPSADYMRQAVLEVYASTKRNPQFVDEEGCTFVGLIKVDIDPQGDIWAKMKVKLVFGGTELIVHVHDVTNNTVTEGCVDFFG